MILARIDSAPWLRQALLTLLLAIDEGVHIVDDIGVTVYYNAQAGELDGLEPESVIGKHILDVYPSLTRESSTLLKVCRTKRPLLSEQQTFTNFKGQRVTTVNMTLPIVVDHRLVGAVEISKNITAVRALSEKLLDLQTLSSDSQTGGSPTYRAIAKHTFADIVGQTPKMVELKSLAQRVAATSSSVLVLGEIGTGKKMLTQAIHNASRRRQRPYLAQSCAAVPETLLEAMLFGTTRASFPSAENRPGLFEVAHKGTLCLEQIAAMSIALQGRLLRALQEGCVRRVGDTRERPLDVRLITTMTEDPSLAIRRGTLRADLFARLSVVTMRVPPLRERREDCVLLANHFVNHYNRLFARRVIGLSELVLRLFADYAWPGNVRELQHALEGAMSTMDGDVIEPAHLPYDLREGRNYLGPAAQVPFTESLASGRSLHDALADVENRLIEQAMQQARGNVTLAAEILRIPRQTLQYKLRQAVSR
ncbi:MAG: Arginine utilization regulatory protein RocR [Firmicutes bacterium]|nr:Arginine utilization regulatory protein RocR [candidate division NPL-UPA2 bacterium]